MNKRFAAILFGIGLLLPCQGAVAATAPDALRAAAGMNIVRKASLNQWLGAEAGVVIAIEGSVRRVSADGKARDIVLGSGVQPGDEITVSGSGRVQWMTPDLATYTVLDDSSVRIEAYAYDRNAPDGDACVILIPKGAFQYVTGDMNQRSPGRTVFRLKGEAAVVPVGSAGYIKIQVDGKIVYFVTEGSLNVGGPSHAAGNVVIVAAAAPAVQVFENAVDAEGTVSGEVALAALSAIGITGETLTEAKEALAAAKTSSETAAKEISMPDAPDQSPPKPLVEAEYNPVEDEIGDNKPSSDR